MDTRDALFIISVAARLVNMHPSTLRKYERCGLLEPCRQGGRLRLYSPRDINRLRQIKTLVEAKGVNLAGVEMALELTHRAEYLRQLCAIHPDETPATSDSAASGSTGEGAPNRLREQTLAVVEEMLKLLGAGGMAGEPDGTNRRSRQTESAWESER